MFSFFFIKSGSFLLYFHYFASLSKKVLRPSSTIKLTYYKIMHESYDHKWSIEMQKSLLGYAPMQTNFVRGESSAVTKPHQLIQRFISYFICLILYRSMYLKDL